VLNFNHELAQVTAYDFMKHYLRDECGVHLLLLGYDNRFGKRNVQETFEDYHRYGKELGIRVILANPVDVGGVRVSSSQVRHAVVDGRMEEVTMSLGRPYSVTGTVVDGHKEGRHLGFPTANIMPPEHKLLPPNGVYAVNVVIDTLKYKGMTNIGTRPTYHDAEPAKGVTIETNIFDFNEDLYGRVITVEFLHKVRDEQQFSSPEALKEQIEKDKEEIIGSTVQ
jgi:riboflavin kinase/FMN adenylyltransferase